MTTTWTVGELALAAGVSVRTLHHYDEIGLLTPARSAAGHRLYGTSDLARLTQVVALRALGLSLEDIRRCLDDGEVLGATLTRQLHDLDEQLAQMRALRDRLATVVDRIQSGRVPENDHLMTLIEDTRMLIEGKTKIIEDAGNGEVLVRSKDEITAGDGAEHDVLEGKAAASTRTTSNIFELLEDQGVSTHFVGRVDDVTFRARSVEMIPLELVARRYATGSFRDRSPDLPERHAFDEVVFETFEKDDARHDPCWSSTSTRGSSDGGCRTSTRPQQSARTSSQGTSSAKSRWRTAGTPTSRRTSWNAFGASPSQPSR